MEIAVTPCNHRYRGVRAIEIAAVIVLLPLRKEVSFEREIMGVLRRVCYCTALDAARLRGAAANENSTSWVSRTQGPDAGCTEPTLASIPTRTRRPWLRRGTQHHHRGAIFRGAGRAVSRTGRRTGPSQRGRHRRGWGRDGPGCQESDHEHPHRLCGGGRTCRG